MSLYNGRFRACNRLKRPEEFRQVFSSRRRSGDRSLLLIAKENGSRVPRLGLAVPKKHIQSAARRNRIKRLIRESFRLHKDQLQGLDVVVVIKQKINIDGVGVNLKKHWKKINQ